MIHHIKGKLVEKTPTYAIIECNGIGYFIHISLNTFTKIGNEEFCKLFTHFVVREDAQNLFGFADIEERAIFQQLISVSGVGAGTARMMLSARTPSELQQAILQADVSTLKSIKGIGGKTAERIIVDLRDKIGKLSVSGNTTELFNNSDIVKQAVTALVALGFNKNASDKVLSKIVASEGNNLKVEQLIKLALKYL